ncbi:YggT family protein [Candidatus Woesebacteria bacterium]|nr:YggT family protein [Candidatus Woesebacteria bacterium]
MGKLLKNFSVLIFSLVGVLLMFRFILKFLGANPSTPFVAFIYENTQPLLEPFLFAFPAPSISGRYVIEFTTLFAMFVYAFISYLIEEVLNLFNRESTKNKN